MIKNKIFNSEKRKKMIAISLIFLLCLAFLGGVIFLACRSVQAEQERKLNCRPENLAKLIKSELAEEKAKIERGQKIKREILLFDGDKIKVPIVLMSENLEWKTGKWEVKKTDLAKEDWDEIVKLYHQNRKLESDKSWEKDKQATKKLKNDANSQLFYYQGKVPSKGFLKRGERQKCHFWGWNKEKKQVYDLLIPENHPSLTKFLLKEEQYYLIEGVKNVPFCQGFFDIEKVVKLPDKITIKPC